MAIVQKRKQASASASASTKTTSIKVPRASLENSRNLTTHPITTPMTATPQLALIAASSKTAFEKRVLSLLCQIPPGSVSTYALLAAHLHSSPRAVGNALRRNPFAPAVPCHRVVATGGQLGGFKGHWSKDGEGITIGEKKRLLRREGVKIDGRGRVMGTPWGAFIT